MATIASNCGALDETELPFFWLSVASASKQQTVAGASQLKFQADLD